ncbi:ABC transporter ATP-binding protein [Mariniblastus sp.]|nr:ABC transporter ATP-binding protein [Mariniblastus sp.]
MIDIRNFSKAYGTALAVDDLTFSVQSGEILGLIGRNGAGKTTTMRALSGIIPSGAGEFIVDGFSLSDAPLELKRRTAYVADDPRLFSDLSVEQHLKFQSSVYGIKNPTDEVCKLLEIFELEPKRHCAASTLSRGMRQKLAICCAYLQAPTALLLDEPMTGLDPHGIRVLKNTIVDRAAQGCSVIISSHLLAMVEDICSHILILDRGKRCFWGSNVEFKERYSQSESTEPNSLERAFFSSLTELGNEVASAISEDTGSLRGPSVDIDSTIDQ